MEDHTTNNCTKNKDYTICSECSNESHILKKTVKLRRNNASPAGGEHSTPTKKCPKRKEIINMKRKEEKINAGTTYANVTGRKTDNTKPTIEGIISSNIHAKIFTCMLHAYFMNLAKNSTYEEELNHILKLNNLPEVKIPRNPPFLNIVTKIQDSEDLLTQGSEEEKEKDYPSSVKNIKGRTTKSITKVKTYEGNQETTEKGEKDHQRRRDRANDLHHEIRGMAQRNVEKKKPDQRNRRNDI